MAPVVPPSDSNLGSAAPADVQLGQEFIRHYLKLSRRLVQAGVWIVLGGFVAAAAAAAGKGSGWAAAAIILGGSVLVGLGYYFDRNATTLAVGKVYRQRGDTRPEVEALLRRIQRNRR